MAQRHKTESKPADWSANTTLKLLRQQLEELQKFKGKNYREAQHEEDAWQQFTSNVIIHGFGEGSQNLRPFQRRTLGW
jgi:stalled ribosome alternative rescue factor ArfA